MRWLYQISLFWVIFDNPGVKQDNVLSKMFKLQSDNSDQPKDRNLIYRYSGKFVCLCFFCSSFVVVVVVVCQSRGHELRLFFFLR